METAEEAPSVFMGEGFRVVVAIVATTVVALAAYFAVRYLASY